MSKPTEERIEQAVTDAEEAFWRSVCQAFPEVTTGDFGPDDTFAFSNACEQAVETWLMYNHPDWEDEK